MLLAQDETASPVPLPTDAVPMAQHAFTLRRSLPPELPADAVMRLKIRHNAVKASVNGIPLELKGVYENRVFGTSTAEMWATISIPAVYAGQQLTLDMEVQNGIPGLHVSDLILINRNTLTLGLIRDSAAVLVLCLLLLALSACLGLACILSRRHRQFKLTAVCWHLACNTGIAALLMGTIHSLFELLFVTHLLIFVFLLTLLAICGRDKAKSPYAKGLLGCML